MMDILAQQLDELISSVLTQTQLILVDLHVRPQGRNIAIQILADKPQGGITLEECSAINRKIGDALEEKKLIAQSYILEVSSPGLDRPLKTVQDFFRVLGREVKFFLSNPVHNKLEYSGIIQKVENDFLVLNLGGATIDIPIQCINKAKQIY